MKREKIAEAVMEALELLYSNCDTPVELKKLIEESTEKDEQGKPIINYDSYQIERTKAEEIIEYVAKKYKIKRDYDKYLYNFNVYLGASPRFY